MKKVYVAGKLNDMAVDYLYNVHKMMTTAEEVRKAGYSVFVPCIDLLMGIKFGYQDYHDYFNNSQPWIEVADAIFLVPGWETSSGTKKEIKLGWNKEIPIFNDLEEMNNYFKLDDVQGRIVGFNLEEGVDDYGYHLSCNQSPDVTVLNTVKVRQFFSERHVIKD